LDKFMTPCLNVITVYSGFIFMSFNLNNSYIW